MMKAVIKRRARVAPHGLQRPIHLEHLADCDDALGSVGAPEITIFAAAAIPVEATELVVVQPVHKGRAEASEASDDLMGSDPYLSSRMEPFSSSRSTANSRPRTASIPGRG